MHSSPLIGRENRLLRFANKSTYERVLGKKLEPAVVAKPMPSTTNPLRVTSGSTQSDIIVSTPGGDIGYNAANYNPVVDPETGVVTAVTPKDTKYTSGLKASDQQSLNDRLGSIEGKLFGSSIQDIAAAKQAEIDKFNVEIAARDKKQAEYTNAGIRAAGTTAAAAANGNPTTNGSFNGNRFQGPSDAAPDRQSFIEKQRTAGKTDAEIRTMINTLPPEQTGGVPTTPQQGTPAPVTPTDAPGSTATPTGTSTTPTTKTKSGATTDTTAPTGPVATPGTNLLRNIANTVTDPILKAVLLAEADQADAIGNPTAMSQAEFLAGADAQSIARPYDAIDKILDRAYQTAQKTETTQMNFLKGQYDRDEKFRAQQQENINNQLSFANDKATRDQADANKKRLDSQTIMLALQGGFGSSDGNAEIADARLKGEQAIIDLNKEFGFKKTDVSLQFTQMHNQALDNYTQNWNTALDNFETKVSNIDIQQISNDQAKGNALGGAYSSYVKDVKDARKEYAKVIADGTKMVLDSIEAERKAKRDGMMSMKDTLGYVTSLQSSISQNKIITLAKDVDGFYGAFNAGFGEYKYLIGEIEAGRMKPGDISLNPAQSGAIGSLARMFDPGSVVRNEEYERQVLGQAAPARIAGWYKQLTEGGTGLTSNDLDAMKRVADGLHAAWEDKLSAEMQPTILNIDKWNAAYPDSQIAYAQVLPVDRVHLPKASQTQIENLWNGDSATSGTSTTSSTSSVTSPSNWLSSIGTGQLMPGSKYHVGKDAYAMDIDGHTGDLIPAAAGGTVISVDYEGTGGYGKNVVIEDAQGYRHIYGHMDSVSVQKDQVIPAGMNVGTMGNTGNTSDMKGNKPRPGDHETGSHLHYAISKGGNAVSFNDWQKFANVDTNTHTQYSLVDTAHASGPEEVIYFKDEPAPEVTKPVKSSGYGVGSTMVSNTQPSASLSYKVIGTFRQVSTGEIIRPNSQASFDYYKSKPWQFKDLEAISDETPAKPIVLGGKILPS